MISKFFDKYFPAFIFLFIFGISFFILHNNVYCIDDLAFTFLEGPIDITRELGYGTWIMKIQYILMYIVPYYFCIDFQTWGQWFGALFKALILVFMSFYFYKLFIFKKISALTSSILAISFYFLLFAFYSKTSYVDFSLFSGFFRFVVPSLLLFICLFYFYKIYSGEKVNLIHLFLLSGISAYSSEVVAVILLTFCCLLLLYKIICEKSNISVFLLIFSGLFSGTLLLISSLGFQSHLSDKLHSTNIIWSNVFANVPEFTSLYFKTMIYDYWYVWVLIILLLFLNSVKKEFKDNIFVFSVITGILAFSYSLIVLGKTHYSGNFWLIHDDIHTIFISVFVYCFAILFSTLLVKFNNSNFLKTFIILFFISSFSVFTFFAVKFYERLYIIKDYEYLREKITLFYSLKHEVPLIPVTALLYNPVLDDLKKIDYEKINDVHLEYLPLEYSDRTSGVDSMSKYYYPLSYGYQIPMESRDIIYLRHNEALELFKQKGGEYDEVLNRTYKFSDLKNYKFILNLK